MPDSQSSKQVESFSTHAQATREPNIQFLEIRQGAQLHLLPTHSNEIPQQTDTSHLALSVASSRRTDPEPPTRDFAADHDSDPEPFLTLIAVAKRLGLPIFKLRRAAKLGLLPTYSFLNGRKLARLSEVQAAIEQSRSGGADE